MKKIIMAVMAAGAMSFAAKADLLYFLVDSFSWEGPKYNFDFATVGVAKQSGDTWVADWNDGQQVYLNIQASPDSGAAASQFIASVPNGRYYVNAGPAWADLGEYVGDGYAFYVETWLNGALDPIWGFNAEKAVGYSDLLEQGHIYLTGTTAGQNVTPWSVPEPTSGLMLLIGTALLALKRRKQAVGR